MNPILPQTNNTDNLIDFMRTTTPQSARQRVLSMVEVGQISKAQFEQYKKQATEIANMLGIK